MECKIEGDEIVVRVKIDALPTAWMLGPHVTQSYDPLDAQNVPPSIIDPHAFAPHFVDALKREDSIGETVVTRCFDAAMLDAIECGADGVEP